MKHNKLLEALQQIEALVAVCLKEAGQSRSTSRKVTAAPSREKTSRNALSDHIVALRNKGFFSQSKTAREVHSKLRPAYECEENRVAMALLRLRKRNQLRKTRKTVGDRKQVAYVW